MPQAETAYMLGALGASPDILVEIIATDAERLESAASRLRKLKSTLAIMGYAPEFATTDAGDVLWMVRDQLDVIEALLRGVVPVQGGFSLTMQNSEYIGVPIVVRDSVVSNDAISSTDTVAGVA